MSLANYLVAQGVELTAVELEDDIRSDPDVYYSDYVALCDELKTHHLSDGAWYDLCRS